MTFNSEEIRLIVTCDRGPAYTYQSLIMKEGTTLEVIQQDVTQLLELYKLLKIMTVLKRNPTLHSVKFTVPYDIYCSIMKVFRVSHPKTLLSFTQRLV